MQLLLQFSVSLQKIPLPDILNIAMLTVKRMKISLGVSAWTTNFKGIMSIYKRIPIYYQKKVVSGEKKCSQTKPPHTDNRL